MVWYQNPVVMSFLGVLLGALISFLGIIVSSIFRWKEIDKQHEYDLSDKNLKRKKEIYNEMIQLIYTIQKMQFATMKADLSFITNESLTIYAKAKIYCNKDVVALYDKFQKSLYHDKVLRGDLVDSQLIPAIRKELGIE